MVYTMVSTSKGGAGKRGSPPKTAKLFRNGRSQAVRLPAEFRFDGTEVLIRRDAVSGDVVLSQPRRRNTRDWRAYFAWARTLNIPDDALPPPKPPPGPERDPFA